MNLVFISVLIFILVLPGIAFRFSYYTYPFARRAASPDILGTVVWSIVPALTVHFLAVTILATFFDVQFNFEHLGFLLLSVNTAPEVKAVFTNIQRNLPEIFLYVFTLCLICAICGRLVNFLVRRFELDTRYTVFRFSNKWYYILTGKALDFRFVPGRSSDVDIVFIDALCVIGNEKILYMGQIQDYYLDDKGELDAITLASPIIRKQVLNEVPVINTISSNLIYIPFKSIINLNVRYFKLEEE